MTPTVIFVPGYPASHLRDATGKRLFLDVASLLVPDRRRKLLPRLEGPDDLAADDPLRAGLPVSRLARFLFFDLAKQADSLYDLLGRLDVEPVRLGWDWRRPVWDARVQTRLAAEIERAARPVVLLVHSTGGLVARRLLESRRDDPGFLARIARVIAFGVPWAGTLKSFLFLTGRQGVGPIPPGDGQRLIATTWSAYDLLPPDPARSDLTDVAGRPLDLVVQDGRQVAPLAAGRRGWFPADLAARMTLRADGADREMGARSPHWDLPVPVTNVVGWGTTTTDQAVLSGAAGADVDFVESKGDDLHSGGDGTVPCRSVAWLRGPGVETFHVPVGLDPGAKRNPHSTLWRNPGGRDLLRRDLAEEPLPPFVHGAVDDDDFYGGDSVRVRLVALGGGGRPLPEATVRLDRAGAPPAAPFPPEGDGRAQVRLSRSDLEPVGTQLRRFVLEVGWRDEDGGEASRKLSFFVRR